MFLWALISLDVFALAGGALFVAGGRSARAAPRPFRELLRATAWILLCVLAYFLFAIAWTSSGFAGLRALAHALFCVGAPLLGWCGVLALRARALTHGCAFIALAVGAEGCYAWARHVEPYVLRVDTFAVELEPRQRTEGGAREPLSLRVALLADLQTDEIGEHERAIFRRLDEGRADLVLFAGDYLQIPLSDPLAYERERAALRALFRSLEHSPRFGFYGVWGDIDLRNDVLEGTPVTMLHDGWAELPAETPFALYGLSLSSSRRELEARVLRSIAEEERPVVVLGHAPDFLVPLLERGDSPWSFLALAGHVHGGQVVLPFFGPPLTLSTVPRELVDGGLHHIGRTAFVISRGLGLERGYAPRIRWSCKPQLVFLELTART